MSKEQEPNVEELPECKVGTIWIIKQSCMAYNPKYEVNIHDSIIKEWK